MRPFRWMTAAAFVGWAAVSLAGEPAFAPFGGSVGHGGASAGEQEPKAIATWDLMKTDWKYAPCKQIKDGNQAGFTWVADGWKKECAETAENGWKAIDHLPIGGKDPKEVMQVGISCGWFRKTIELPTQVGDVDVTGSAPFLVFTVDDYGETWIDGKRDIVKPIGQPQPWEIKGFNVPVVVDLSAKPYGLKPGAKFQLAIFAVNGPIPNPYGGYWFRGCKIEFRK